MEREEETIDLGKLFAIIVDRKKLFGGIVAGFRGRIYPAGTGYFAITA